MAEFSLDVVEWAEKQFGTCELGDRRRNKRLVKFAAQIASHPAASTPHQTRTWADCKGAYRLMDCEDLTFPALIAPHCRHTREQSPTEGCSLIIHDTTEVSFSTQRGAIEGLGSTGRGLRQGFHLHTALKVSADSQEVLGIAGQLLFSRQAAPKKKGGKRETAAEVKRRPRESEIRRRLIEQVGPAPEGQTYLHLCDRGADNYEVFAQASLLDTGWIVRAAQLHRKVRNVVPETPHDPGAGVVTTVDELLAAEPLVEGYDVAVPATKTRSPRTARVALRWVSLWMPRPQPCSSWGDQGGEGQVFAVHETVSPLAVGPCSGLVRGRGGRMRGDLSGELHEPSFRRRSPSPHVPNCFSAHSTTSRGKLCHGDRPPSRTTPSTTALGPLSKRLPPHPGAASPKSNSMRIPSNSRNS